MIRNQLFELSWPGNAPVGNEAQIPLTAVFTAPSGNTVEVKGFYAGNGTYKVRFLPEEAGEYRVCAALDGKPLPVECPLAAEDVCAHGKVAAEGFHFRYADGTRYIPFGTTVYALVHQEDTLVDQTIESLKKSPFNKVRLCVFPKDYVYNHNEPPVFPFEKDSTGKWDVKRPCYRFWDRFENILDKLEAEGIEVDLILFHPYDRWGFASLTREENHIYLDYLLRRLAARPGIWWSMANEYDCCVDKTQKDWEDIEAYLAENDPFHHLLSNHNCFQPWDAARPNITHASLQRKVISYVYEWRNQYQKPIMIDECGYEGDLPEAFGCFSGREITAKFWRCYCTGGYMTHGETFVDPTGQEIVWWAKGGTLRGESIPRIAFLRAIMGELPGPIEPIPDHIAAALNPALRPMLEQRIPHLPKEYLPTALALLNTDPEELRQVVLGDMDYKGKCAGDQAFLFYFDLHCYSSVVLPLPDEGKYRVEVLDTWEMTRDTVAEAASGNFRVDLPGKEAMAVLAVKVG